MSVFAPLVGEKYCRLFFPTRSRQQSFCRCSISRLVDQFRFSSKSSHCKHRITFQPFRVKWPTIGKISRPFSAGSSYHVIGHASYRRNDKLSRTFEKSTKSNLPTGWCREARLSSSKASISTCGLRRGECFGQKVEGGGNQLTFEL